MRRLERFAVRLAAARERSEGAGGASLAGGGEEFVGYRPYRPGEDLRQLDWNLYARLDRPWVRVTRREASEHWAVLVDTSASMGVGEPGKLQAAAETACALACVGARAGARVLVRASGSPESGQGGVLMRRPTELPALLAYLAAQRASGSHGLGPLVARGVPSEAGRVFLIGDLFDVRARDVLPALGRGRELLILRVLAPLEVSPPRSGAVEWLDPEGDGRLALTLDARLVGGYLRRLERSLEAWGRRAAVHGFRYRVSRSDEPFEDVVRGLLGG